VARAVAAEKQGASMLMPFSLAILALLIAAAWRDVATRTIPDTISLLLAVTGGLARVVEGSSALAFSAATALLLFVPLLIAFSRGVIGGGDVKLMTALAVGLAPLDCYRFVIATALVGGLLGISYLLLSRLLPSSSLQGLCQTKRTSFLGRVAAVEFWRIRRRGPLPYGVAIAAAGAFILFHHGGP
jgi:prepilin peptidase CpaA